MSRVVEKKAVDFITYRMNQLGIDLPKYIQEVLPKTDLWLTGFNFISPDWKALAMVLIKNNKFVTETGLEASFQKGPSWREISSSDSLHLVYSKGYPYEGYPKAIPHFNIHIDTVSVTKKCNAGTNDCVYSLATILNHNLTDNWSHKVPFSKKIYVSDDEYLNAGIRFDIPLLSGKR